MENQSIKENGLNKLPPQSENTPKYDSANGIRTLRERVELHCAKFGNALILILGAWETGKTTLAKILTDGIVKFHRKEFCIST